MSFSRAKLQRFNEILNVTPSPAAYNLPIKTTPTNATISRTVQPADLQSNGSSSNGGSAQSIFRTPNPPKKGKCLFNQKPKSEKLKMKTKSEEEISYVIEEKVNDEKRLEEYKISKEKEIAELNSKYRMLQDDFEAKIKQLEENHREANILSEILMKEKYEGIEREWEIKLEEVERKAESCIMEYQAREHRNAAQHEIEKHKILCDLAQHKDRLDEIQRINVELQNECDALREEQKNLQIELQKTASELKAAHERISKEHEEREINVHQAMRDKHLYEITIEKTHKTVEALKRRLMKSDLDVEQLKAELEATEESKLEVEEKCSHLLEELEIVKGLCDVAEEQNELSVNIAKEKILKLEQELLTKVDYFKIRADEKVQLLLEEHEKTKKQLKEVMEQLHDQQALNSKAQECLAMSESEIHRLESLIVQQELSSLKLRNTIDENCKLKTVIELMQASESDLLKQINDLKQQLKQKDAEPENFNEILEKLKHLEIENVQLRKTVSEEDALIGPFRSTLEAYEKEYNLVLSEKENFEKEAKEISLKYSEMLGHQNHKQKIKHLKDLKLKNFQLSDENKKLHKKIKLLTEKLRSEKTSVIKSSLDNKENLDLSSGRVGSPGPLKDWN